MFFPVNRHILQSLLDRVVHEEEALGTASRKTLLLLAEFLVRFAPNLYTSPGASCYSDEEKAAAKALLKKYGWEQFANLSPRYKRMTLQAIKARLKKEA